MVVDDPTLGMVQAMADSAEPYRGDHRSSTGTPVVLEAPRPNSWVLSGGSF